MRRFIIKRLLALVPILLLVAIGSFMLIHLTPGDPAAHMLGLKARDKQIEIVRHQLGLDKPIGVQLINWLKGILKGDLGRSFFLGKPVTHAIAERLPVTMLLAVNGLIIALTIGIPLGIISAVNRGKIADQASITLSVIGISVPDFWLASMFIWFFAVQKKWLPSGQYMSLSQGFLPWLRHLILPSITLGLTSAALIARITRSAMLEVLNQDYIRTARAKGIKETIVINKHAFRNSLLSVITVIGMLIGTLISGAVVMENIFAIPGMGRLIVQAVKHRDYPLIQGGVLFISLVYILVNFLTDIIYVYIDPRIKY